MKLEPTPEGNIVFDEIDPFLAALLRQIPAAADPGDNSAARDRIFSEPMEPTQPDAAQMREEWSEYVRPELRHLFETALATIQNDVDSMEEQQLEIEGEPLAFFRMEVPAGHLDAWLNGLNQARLVLSAKYGFGERELSEDQEIPFRSRRDFALMQVEFYGRIQEQLLWRIQGGDPSPPRNPDDLGAGEGI